MIYTLSILEDVSLSAAGRHAVDRQTNGLTETYTKRRQLNDIYGDGDIYKTQTVKRHKSKLQAGYTLDADKRLRHKLTGN